MNRLQHLQMVWDEEALARTAVRRARLAMGTRAHWPARIAGSLIAITALALAPGLARADTETLPGLARADSETIPGLARAQEQTPPYPVGFEVAATPLPEHNPALPDAPAGAFPSLSDPGETREARLRRDATRWEVAWQVLNVVDMAQTARCRARNTCTEANPGLRLIIGKEPKPGAVIAAKAGFGLVHWLIFTHLRHRDPAAARTAAQFSVALQGGVVALNFARGF